ncbi:MAG TPA: hypothetical protein ENN73_00860, partial [Firmicutes bacterium]|nr:hypothetical protein [Bacillota bacterium]
MKNNRKKEKAPETKSTNQKSELLKYKNALFDSGIELPSYSLMIDEIRKALDVSKVCGLIFLSIANSSKFEYTFGWEAFDEILKFISDRLKEYLKTDKEHSPVLTVRNVRNDEFIIFYFESSQYHNLT